MTQYHVWKAAGLCAYCGMVPPEPDRTKCSACKHAQTATRRRRNMARYKLGLCAYCGKRPRVGVQCRECADQRAARTTAYRSKYREAANQARERR